MIVVFCSAPALYSVLFLQSNPPSSPSPPTLALCISHLHCMLPLPRPTTRITHTSP